MIWRSTTFRWATPNFGCGPRITSGPDGWKATATIHMSGKPSKIQQAIKDFRGYSEVKLVGGKRTIARTLPFALPVYRRQTGRPILWCTGFQVEEYYTKNRAPNSAHEADPVVAENKLPWLRYAKCVLSFSSFRFHLREDTDPLVLGESGDLAGKVDESKLARFVLVIPRPRIRTVTAPSGSFTWKGLAPGETNAPAAFGTPLHEPGNDLTYRWVDVPEINYTAINRAMGSVNATAFDGHPPGSLMCMAPDIQPTVQSNGESAFTIDHKLHKLSKIARYSDGGAEAGKTERGHNFFARRFQAGGVFKVDYRELRDGSNGTGEPPFRSTEFRDLFRLDP